MTEIAEQHKHRLREYFDGVGYERWAAIYGDGPLSRMRRSIRDGHAEMLGLAEAWLAEGLDQRPATSDQVCVDPSNARSSFAVRPWSILDAGCGTGVFSLALARRGWQVTAVDIAPQMVAAARERVGAAGLADRATFLAGDLEVVEGTFDAVACFDVLIHYGRAGFARMCRQLAGLTRGPLLLTYAPHEPLLAALHWVGGRFPHGSRRTDIQMLPERFVRATLAEAGMRVRRQARISRGVYHVALVEAVPV